MRYSLIPFSLLYLCSCEQQTVSNSSSQSEIEVLQRQKDSLRQIANNINSKQSIEQQEPPKIIEEFVFAKIDYTVARENFVKGTKIEGSYDLDGKYMPGLEIPDRYETIFVPYFYISPIRNIKWNSMYLDEDLKYKFLDEMEANLRRKTIGNTIKIVKREVKIFPTYAEASKSIEQLKAINQLNE